MQYRRLGRTGINVSEVSYGAARGAVTAPEDFLATVQAAIEGGVNFIDTASKYDDGESERQLGQALAGRDDVFVETKYLPYDSFAPEAKYTGNPGELVTTAEECCRRLRRDHLDVLLGHGMRTLESYDRFMADGCYAAMVKLKEQGTVRYIGISELSEADGTHEVLRRAVPTGAFDVVMLTVNVLLQTAIADILPLCRQHDVGTVVMMPLNQASRESGLVSVDAARECVRRHIAAGNLPDEPPYTDADLFDFLKPYSVPAAALRFVLAQDVSTCCVGAQSPARIRENLRVSDPPHLDDERRSRLATLFGRIKSQVR
ncbi:aldo/keto reductase [bacterium]|nr:aldo/keto reductase [bacterium]